MSLDTALSGRSLTHKIGVPDLTLTPLCVQPHRLVEPALPESTVIEVKLIFLELASHLLIDQYLELFPEVPFFYDF